MRKVGKESIGMETEEGKEEDGESIGYHTGRGRKFTVKGNNSQLGTKQMDGRGK